MATQLTWIAPDGTQGQVVIPANYVVFGCDFKFHDPSVLNYILLQNVSNTTYEYSRLDPMEPALTLVQPVNQCLKIQSRTTVSDDPAPPIPVAPIEAYEVPEGTCMCCLIGNGTNLSYIKVIQDPNSDL